MSYIDKEKKTVEAMVGIYCEHNHGNKSLCEDCITLLNFCNHRLDKCPFKEKKGNCKACPIHCYKPSKRKLIKKVMQFSGPRMLLKYPILALRHIILSFKSFPNMKKKVCKLS
jgi:hypothetical protein